MARLCAQMNALLQDNVLKRLHQRKIFTVVDLLQEDPEKLVHITQLAYKDVLKMWQCLIANYSALPKKGIDAYNEILANTALISSKITSLDDMLEGGFMTGKIYEVCGPSGSGKTQLCLTVATNVAHDFQQQLHYIDTKRDFSGTRVHEMLEAKHYEDEVVGRAMERIRVTRIHDIYQLFSFLHHLKSVLQQEQDGQHSVRIVILDSLPILFYPFLGDSLNDGLGLMQHLGNTMKFIATEHHIVFLVVNLASQLFEEDTVPVDANLETTVREDMRPAIGKTWLDVPCTRLLINKTDAGETRQITVMKSTYVPVGSHCKVNIDTSGVISV